MFITMFLHFLLLQDIVDSNFRLFRPLSPGGIVGKILRLITAITCIQDHREKAIASCIYNHILCIFEAPTCALLL